MNYYDLHERIQAKDGVVALRIMRERFNILFEGQVMQLNAQSERPTPEQIGKVRKMSWQEIAEALYQILDDIDTYSGVCKENLQLFQNLVLKKQQEKNHYLYSPDGYGLKKISEAVLLETYRQVKTDKVALLLNGVNIEPVATLVDESGGRAQIGVDDGCYVLYLKQPEGWYKSTSWIFSEAFKVLKGLPPLSEGLVDHAKRELKLAGMFDDKVEGSVACGEWNKLCSNAVMELMELFAEQGHSGMSASMTRELFNRLAAYQPLTELTDSPDEWMLIAEDMWTPGEKCWQNRRKSSCFSTDGGKTYYDIDDDSHRFVGENGETWFGRPEDHGKKTTIYTSKQIAA